MGKREIRAAAILSALAAVLSVVLAVSPAHAVDYPSWDEVEAARGNEAATAATISQISQLLDGLQAEAARLGDEAVARSAEADAARIELDRATAEAESLDALADAAATRAARSAARASEVAAALYRSGGSDLTGTLLLTSDQDSSALLYRLGALGRIGGQFGFALDRAQIDANQSLAISDQAEVARAERDRLSDAAQAALQAAQEAQAAADAAVVAQQANLTQLYQQLASLKNTTVQLEQQWRIGQDSGGGGGSGDAGGPFTVPGSSVNDPAAAKAFAFAQLASMGFGGDQNNCLLWLWNRESGWRTNAYNASSGAYGIPQSLPGSKMANYAADWRTNYQTQVMWGLIYIQGRYGSPCGAWAHSESYNWY